MSVSPFVKYETLQIARAMSPEDTGNVKYNAIHLRNVTNKGWTIAYSTSDAYYLVYLEDDANNKHAGFIKNTAEVIAGYIAYRVAGRKKSSLIRERDIEKFTQDYLSNVVDTSRREQRNLNSIRLSKGLDFPSDAEVEITSFKSDFR
jgi:hypothetical protein